MLINYYDVKNDLKTESAIQKKIKSLVLLLGRVVVQ